MALLEPGDRVERKGWYGDAGVVLSTYEDNEGFQLVRVAWDDGRKSIEAQSDLVGPSEISR